MPPRTDGRIIRRRLSVIIREVSPFDRPRIGTDVEVVLDGELVVPGRVIDIMDFSTIRVELRGE